MYTTDMYEGMIAETININGHNNDQINAYFARPINSKAVPGIVLIHHLPGWDEWYRETTRKFAHHGFAAISPNLYFRDGHGEPDDIAAKVRAEGGAPDEQVIGDVTKAMKYLKNLPYSNGKVAVFGTCSGGRHAFLTACNEKGFDAVIECWGGKVVMSKEELNDKQPVSPVDYTKELNCPILGLFGADDESPTPEQVKIHENELKKHNKNYEFHMYESAGHGFFYYDKPVYRPEACQDGWEKIFDFLERKL